MGRGNSLDGNKRMPFGAMALVGALLIGSPALVTFVASPSQAQTQAATTVHWDDGDSGEVNGLRFRLADVDSPEKGGVGAAVGAALCEEERRLGLQAKAYMEKLTTNGRVTITAKYDIDRDGRQVLDLAVDGEDIAKTGMRDGILRSYKFEGRKRMEPKPDWCAKHP